MTTTETRGGGGWCGLVAPQAPPGAPQGDRLLGCMVLTCVWQKTKGPELGKTFGWCPTPSLDPVGCARHNRLGRSSRWAAVWCCSRSVWAAEVTVVFRSRCGSMVYVFWGPTFGESKIGVAENILKLR